VLVLAAVALVLAGRDAVVTVLVVIRVVVVG
jgi:hypothetical protein